MSQPMKLPIPFKLMPRKPPGADLVPYMQALTIVVISIPFFFWRERTWNHRGWDLNAALICLIFNYLQQPLLTLGLAIGYTVCSTIPGSWASLNLPEYSEFKRRLDTLPPGEDEDCMICYDNNHPLARLPCDHRCCTGCLDLMAVGYQTTCPACRRPLFSASDEIIYALTRGSVAGMAANTILLFFVGLQELRASDYKGALVSLGCQCAQVPFLWFYGNLMWSHGNDWWREIFTAAKMSVWDLRMAAFAFASGIFASSSILWVSRGFFS